MTRRHAQNGCTGAWEQYGVSRKCADCKKPMDPAPASPEPVSVSERPDWDTYYLAGAAWAATRADCTRAQVGALVVSRDHRVSVGYNGLPAGIPGCASEGNCPRGAHAREMNTGLRGELIAWCRCGKDWPCPDAAAPDSDYANCAATHAERNAITRARPEDLAGATLYVTRAPCPACWTLIRAAKLYRVVTPEEHILVS